jgi:hypothetical protein
MLHLALASYRKGRAAFGLLVTTWPAMIRPMQMPSSAMLPALKAPIPSRLGSRLVSVLLAGLAGSAGAGALLALAPLGARAQAASPAAGVPSGRQVIPVRWTSGVGVWSLQPEAIRRFVETGVVSDRSLDSAINRSGWSPEELRLGLAKPYSVDLVALARFLYSSDGLAFLRTQTSGYVPSRTQSSYAVEALRSAIIAAAAGGQISALTIMAHLPTDFSTVQACGHGDGRLNVCAAGLCIGEAQCTSLLSWYVFLPACLQANQARQAAPALVSPFGKQTQP